MLRQQTRIIIRESQQIRQGYCECVLRVAAELRSTAAQSRQILEEASITIQRANDLLKQNEIACIGIGQPLT